MRKVIYFKITAFFWTASVTILSLKSNVQFADAITIPYKDKVVHFTFYFIFCWLWYLGLQHKTIRNLKLVLLYAVLYGVLMEVFQGCFTLTRQPDFYDIVANCLGGLVAYAILQKQTMKPFEN